MSAEVRALEPQELWNNFSDLNEIPRGSKKEEKVIEFMKNFGEGLGLETIVDEVGNVIIKKPASPGMEGTRAIALQSHLDMVHQKNADTDFDFDTQGIEMFVDGDWVKAKGTTLGSDNGIGVAAIMSLLASRDIKHPPLEALFTIDEETGMTGAEGLKGGLMEANVMLNLDTEEDEELVIGCAGGINVTAEGSYTEETLNGEFTFYQIKISGLKGGHSGLDIHLGRANASKLMNRFINELDKSLGARISYIEGGTLRNALPREAVAVIAVHSSKEPELKEMITGFDDILKSEYSTTDPDAAIAFHESESSNVLERDFQKKLLKAVYACPHGIYRMSPDIEGLVQTSNNLARVLVKDGQYEALCLARSSSESEKADMVNVIRSVFELIGAKVEANGSYPGWEPKPEAGIVKLMEGLYEELHGSKAHVCAVHAGLECGILGTNYPDMEMISFGPNIIGAHSPDERVQVSSVQKFWNYLLEALNRSN